MSSIRQLPRVVNLGFELLNRGFIVFGQLIRHLNDPILVFEFFIQGGLGLFEIFAFLVGLVEILEEFLEVFGEVGRFRVLLDFGDGLQESGLG